MDRMLKVKKREGSVLLQTLVMCVILSFIAVSLTRWALGRYSAVNKTYSDSSFNGAAMQGIGNNFSVFSYSMSSGGTSLASGCNITATSGTTSEGTGYSPSCTKISGTNSNKYVFTLTIP